MNAPLACGPALPAAEYAALRRRAIFECGKWDPQVEDTSVLARFPILVSHGTWRELARLAERLDAEARAAERELHLRPELHAQLGLPRAIRRALRAGADRDADIWPRYARFDFHPTPDGWRISEANTDVPGGLIEASGVAALVAAAGSEAAPTGDPATALLDALLAAAPNPHHVALVHATAYTDDRQVADSLARGLARRGVNGHLVSPTNLCWTDGRAVLTCVWLARPTPADVIFRFFPAEWLANLPRSAAWTGFFRTSTPQCNPPTALLTQTKRFPLVWDRLQTPLPTWRSLLPETRDPRRIAWQRRADWVLKHAMGRVGEDVAIPGVTSPADHHRMSTSARWHPGQWVVQRRFDLVPVHTPDGPRYPCLGVFVVNGRCAGAYGRLSRTPLIDGRAQEAAILAGNACPPAEQPADECTLANR